MNIYYKQSDITASLSELMMSPWALECDGARGTGIQEALHLIQDMINGEVPESMKIPAADIKPVMRGKWVPKNTDGSWRIDTCSACKKDTHYVRYAPAYDYCPNCGADMRES